MKVIVATESTCFAGRGRHSDRGRDAETALRHLDAIRRFIEPGAGRAGEGIQ